MEILRKESQSESEKWWVTGSNFGKFSRHFKRERPVLSKAV
jgi:hypothetical protein